MATKNKSKSIKSSKPAKSNKTKRSAKSKKTRIEYGFKLNFPSAPFTVQTLMERGAKPQYITAYKRVEAALKAGTIVVVGEKQEKKPRRGRRSMLYQRADAKVNLISATSATVEPVAVAVEAVADTAPAETVTGVESPATF